MSSVEESMTESERNYEDKPYGIWFVEVIKRKSLSYKTHQSIVLIVTFLAYTCYHATRKTTSIVKSVLDPESSETSLQFLPWERMSTGSIASRLSSWILGSGWAPFNGSNGSALLGDIDVAFLGMYAIGMYFSGQLGDRLNLRIFLTVGMVGTGVFTALFGAGYWLNIHTFYYFLIVQMIAGLFQSTGWPSVVAVVGNWFGKSKRGLIMGIWNAHTSVGNITGSLIASAMLQYGWGWSFAVPAMIIAFIGVVVFLFLPVSPEAVGADKQEDDLQSPKKAGEAVTEPLLSSDKAVVHERAVGFIEAWKIPGVAPFALCLFFAKLVAYTFLYWLPFYISHTEINGTYYSSETAGNLSTLFDVGGVVGGILAGHISDRLDARAIAAASFMYLAIPALFLYRCYGYVSLTVNIMLMLITGFFVNGPYALITTAVSADLGTHSSLKGNSRALATVTAIIDGTGSVGAAIGPLLTGYISAVSWSAVFTMLMLSALIAGLLLTKLVMAEVAAKMEKARLRRDTSLGSPVESIEV
ncbi:Major facilitator superfamily [Dillenia turbinata]|uniref:Major facilitator superfamily n=1 Tax=Dillenia turbinata TaxID=194707 RepID=A0AAN8VZG4_9MAGN